MPSYTRGFHPASLGDHFDKHKRDFGVATEQEYEALADTFLGAPCPPDVLECTRISSGDIIRFKETTDEYGVLSRTNVIRTFFKPKPRIHRLRNNLEYFRAECRK